MNIYKKTAYINSYMTGKEIYIMSYDNVIISRICGNVTRFPMYA